MRSDLAFLAKALLKSLSWPSVSERARSRLANQYVWSVESLPESGIIQGIALCRHKFCNLTVFLSQLDVLSSYYEKKFGP